MCVREHVLCLVKSLILKLVKYFEMSFLKNRKRQTLLLNMSFDCQEYEQSHTFLQNFDSPIGCRAIKKFLERIISENRLSVLIRAVCCRVILNQASTASMARSFILQTKPTKAVRIFTNDAD